MRRLLRGAIGTMVAGGIFGIIRPALAQTSYLYRGRAEQVRETPDRSTNPEAMKVELALLADAATFPYNLTARFSGGALEVRGYVPNEMIRRRALEIVRRNTSLRVNDGVMIQPNPANRPISRGVQVLQKESERLLLTSLGDSARQIRAAARPDGTVLLTGTVRSLEEQLAVSKLFRQMPDCSGVLNNLTVSRIVRDGQRVVPVTKDGKIATPFASARTAPTPEKQPANGLVAPMPSCLDAREGELRLPIGPAKPAQAQADRAAAAKQPAITQWTRPAMNWESQVKEAPKQSPAKTISALPVAKKTSKTAKKKKADVFASESRPAAPAKPAPSSTSVALTVPTIPARWQRPAAVEEAEPRAEAVAKPEKAPLATAKPAKTAAGPPVLASAVQARPAPVEEQPRSAMPPLRSTPGRLDRPAHWPPAYDARPAASNQGSPGVIVFDEPPASPASPAKNAKGKSRFAVPDELQRQVKAACGRKAHEVRVEMQRDGSVLVRVKVGSAAVGDQLTRKILMIPEMALPNVHLTMDVGR